MKITTALLSASLGSGALAFPGMKGNAGLADFHQNLARRVNAPIEARQNGGPPPPAPLPPNLANLTNFGVQKQIKDCLSTEISCEAEPVKTYRAPRLGSAECDADKCCVWDYVVGELIPLFTEKNGECGELARQAIRLGFHDAGAWSLTSGYGGADGSIIISDEIDREENRGLERIVGIARGLVEKYGIGAADLAQMMSNLGTVVCPLGPRVLTWVGRHDSPNSPNDLLPGAFSDADTLIALFEDKTISPNELIALIGAHSTSNQEFVDPDNAGSFQDSTPGVWDVAYYTETLDDSFTRPDLTKFPSDVALAKHPRTVGPFRAFTNQAIWNAAYARAYVRLSLLGVNNVAQLTDCTKVLPSFIGQAPPPSNNGGSGKPSGSGKPKPSASKPYGGSNDYTTTVTSYFTENGWRIPVHTSVCEADKLPEWAKTPEWSFEKATVSSYPIPTGKGKKMAVAPAPTSKPKYNGLEQQPACIVKTVYVTTTLW